MAAVKLTRISQETVVRGAWLWIAAAVVPPVWGWIVHRALLLVWPASAEAYPPADPATSGRPPHDFQI